jgi:hypothetical protein
MALHADTRELGPATRSRASDALGGFGGGASGHWPEHGRQVAESHMATRKRCDTTDYER